MFKLKFGLTALFLLPFCMELKRLQNLIIITNLFLANN